jgi:hypothetical protein
MGARRPFFHRHGVLYDATFTTPNGEQRALVRLSRSFGWPEPLPEWVGCAVRLFGDENGKDVDLILASSAPEPDLWRQLRPSRDVLACTFTSKVNYLVNGGEPEVVTAVPTDGRSAGFDEVFGGEVALPIRYRIQTGDTPGVWYPWGELQLTDLRPDDPAIRFHPPLEPEGRVTRVRRKVYDWVQRR